MLISDVEYPVVALISDVVFTSVIIIFIVFFFFCSDKYLSLLVGMIQTLRRWGLIFN